jgi:hypothetical protein
MKSVAGFRPRLTISGARSITARLVTDGVVVLCAVVCCSSHPLFNDPPWLVNGGHGGSLNRQRE